MLSPWAAVRVCTRRGTAHQRRGQPCQDASLQRPFTTLRGEPLVLLVVADGHGASRHHRSEVGSALACQAAAATLEEALDQGLEPSPAKGADPPASDALQHWLAEGWPAAVQRHWRAATEAHWQEHPAADGAPYSPIPYGTTLGLLLLGRRWWAHAGLGDWDLVRISEAGGVQLLSQEEAPPGAGEATWSLCQEREGPLTGWRWGVEPRAEGADCTLVLSTDGVRKSCASDGDFLALARWLADVAEEPPAVSSEGDLASALDRISREGCGDDVSVALAAIAPGAPGQPEAPERQLPAGRPVHARPGGRPFGRTGLSLGLVALALGLTAAVRWVVQERAAPSDAWRREVERLCRAPELVGPSLASRRSQVEALRQGLVRPEVLLEQPQRDPLGALIAAGFPALPPEQLRQSGFARLPLCPALRRGLVQIWRLSPSPAAPPLPPAPATPLSPSSPSRVAPIAPGVRHD